MAVFAVVVRFLLIEAINGLRIPSIFVLLAIIAVVSILVGNPLALRQNNIKRILGYSSIAHFGYLLVLVLTGGVKLGLEGFAAYLAIYVVTALAAFGVVTLMSKSAKTATLITQQIYAASSGAALPRCHHDHRPFVLGWRTHHRGFYR